VNLLLNLLVKVVLKSVSVKVTTIIIVYIFLYQGIILETVNVTVIQSYARYCYLTTMYLSIINAQQIGAEVEQVRLIWQCMLGVKSPVHWEDITNGTSLKLVNDCVTFTTTMSGR